MEEGFVSVRLNRKCRVLLGPKLNSQQQLGWLAVKISSMALVILTNIFMVLPTKWQILTEKLHAYLMNVSFISKHPLKYSAKLFPILKDEVEQQRTSQVVPRPKLSKWNKQVCVSCVLTNSLKGGFFLVSLLWRWSAFWGPKMNLHLQQRSLGVKIRSMNGVILPKTFLTVLGKGQILAEKNACVSRERKLLFKTSREKWCKSTSRKKSWCRATLIIRSCSTAKSKKLEQTRMP